MSVPKYAEEFQKNQKFRSAGASRNGSGHHPEKLLLCGEGKKGLKTEHAGLCPPVRAYGRPGIDWSRTNMDAYRKEGHNQGPGSTVDFTRLGASRSDERPGGVGIRSCETSS